MNNSTIRVPVEHIAKVSAELVRESVIFRATYNTEDNDYTIIFNGGFQIDLPTECAYT